MLTTQQRQEIYCVGSIVLEIPASKGNVLPRQQRLEMYRVGRIVMEIVEDSLSITFPVEAGISSTMLPTRYISFRCCVVSTFPPQSAISSTKLLKPYSSFRILPHTDLEGL